MFFSGLPPRQHSGLCSLKELPQPFSTTSPWLRVHCEFALSCVPIFPVQLPWLVGNSSEAGALFSVLLCPQHLKECLTHSRPSLSVSQALNLDKPMWSLPWRGLCYREITRKLLGQSWREGRGGAGLIQELPGWHSGFAELSTLWPLARGRQSGNTWLW